MQADEDDEALFRSLEGTIEARSHTCVVGACQKFWSNNSKDLESAGGSGVSSRGSPSSLSTMQTGSLSPQPLPDAIPGAAPSGHTLEDDVFSKGTDPTSLGDAGFPDVEVYDLGEPATCPFPPLTYTTWPYYADDSNFTVTREGSRFW